MKQDENQKIKSGYDRWIGERDVLRRSLNIASDVQM